MSASSMPRPHSELMCSSAFRPSARIGTVVTGSGFIAGTNDVMGAS